MNEKIQIKVGSNISSILQSTVNVPQAFTEIIKNSIQNLSSKIEIKLTKEEVSILDNGKGFNHIKDSSGKNDFDKYFVFGNSYDTTEGSGIRLGHMGIGGKVSNDKLSSVDPDWSIITKNESGKTFKVDYKPSSSEFLDDYNPELKEITSSNSEIKSETGTKIIINKTSNRINNNLDYVKANVLKELKSFFAHLIKENPDIQIIFNGESLSFNYKLTGVPFINKEVIFKYNIKDKEQEAKIKFNISYEKDLLKIKNSSINCIDIVSSVKICKLNLENGELLNEIYEEIEKKENKPSKIEPSTLSFFNNLIGFISCEELSSVLDESNMPAKDLSHHYLRVDHPITTPFLKVCFSEIINSIRDYTGVDETKRREKFDEIAKEVMDLVSKSLDIKDVEYDYKVKESLPDGIIPDLPDYLDLEKLESKINEDPIVYDISDFGEDSKYEMSNHFEHKKLIVMINSGNSKFIKMESSSDPYALASYISECIIKEASFFKNPDHSNKEVEYELSKFYDEHGDSMREKFSF